MGVYTSAPSLTAFQTRYSSSLVNTQTPTGQTAPSFARLYLLMQSLSSAISSLNTALRDESEGSLLFHQV